MGINDASDRSSPVQLSGTTWTHIEWSKRHALGIKNDYTLWAWGQSFYGSLGQNTGGGGFDRSSPVQIPGTQWSHAGSIHGNSSAAIKTDGTLWMWGYSNYGQLGLDKISRSSPVQVPGTTWDIM